MIPENFPIHGHIICICSLGCFLGWICGFSSEFNFGCSKMVTSGKNDQRTFSRHHPTTTTSPLQQNNIQRRRVSPKHYHKTKGSNSVFKNTVYVTTYLHRHQPQQQLPNITTNLQTNIQRRRVFNGNVIPTTQKNTID